MKYVRIKTYVEGEFTGSEHAYGGDNQENSIKRFLKEYPEHKGCELHAEVIDDADSALVEWFRIARMCGCVHFF